VVQPVSRLGASSSLLLTRTGAEHRLNTCPTTRHRVSIISRDERFWYVVDDVSSRLELQLIQAVLVVLPILLSWKLNCPLSGVNSSAQLSDAIVQNDSREHAET